MSSNPEELSFTYFPENYRWSHGLLIGLNMAPWGGAEIGEVNRIGLRLKSRVGDDDAWFWEWTREARTVEARGRERIADGRTLSGAQYLRRASAYYHVGERFLQPKSQEGLDAYMCGVQSFRDAAKYINRPRIEHLEIPYGEKSLPAIYVHAEPANTSGKVPAVVFFDGLDVTKEIQYFKGVTDLVGRGIACLIVDGPGNGESIRFRGMYLRPDTEHYATPVFDYLASRPEVDPKRIGVMAISLGGYYAPRAAAFEQRYACCLAWGAQWDYQKIWRDRFERLARADTPSLSVAAQHISWVLNASSQEDALKRLEPFKLDGVVQKITCPFLMLHGEGDEQIPSSEAQKCFDAVGSKRKTMKIFTREEGGYHHCQIDNQSICSAYMWDWLEQVLQPRQ
ncbi:MAG TPA: alpha/beta hydrolase [Pseudolabrys sp.]|nr:alpha/beta hydrolase [Pseudolabrys sp.]